MNKDFIVFQDFSEKEILALLEMSKKLKVQPLQPLLTGKTLGLLFTKSSTRTRVSFEVGISQLGGHSIFLDAQSLQMERGETIADTAKVLSRYLDALVIRTYAHQDVVEFAQNASMPIINGLTDALHPCQILADLFTLYERRGEVKNLTVVYVGDGSNNVAHTWLFAAAVMGIKLVIASPVQYWPDPEHVRASVKLSSVGSKFFEVTKDVMTAVGQADVIYTDVWVSMGKEKENAKRLKDLAPYQVNEALLKAAPKEALVMHCLPAHRGEEISGAVLDGPQSVVFDEAENRLHTQKALMLMLMGNETVLKKLY